MAQFNYNISVTGDCQNNNGGSISILPYGGTPPYTVDWVSPALNVDYITALPSTRTGLGSGTYALRINDSTIPVNYQYYVNVPVSNGVCTVVNNSKNTTCGFNNGSITGSSTSDYSSANYYLYLSNGTFISSAITNTSFVVFNNLTAGTYNMVVQDLGGCTGCSQTIVIEDSSEFDFGYYVVPNTSCGGSPIGKIYITGETGYSPYTYSWSNGQSDSYITGLTQGNYSVQVTDYYGCTKTKSIYVPNVDAIGFGNFVVTQPSCFQNNGAIRMEITGGTAPYYYSASTGYYQISYSKIFTLTGLTSGSYSIKATDSGFCSFTKTAELVTPNGIKSVSVNGTNSSCSQKDGSISIQLVGGSSPYTYTLVYPTSNTSSISTVNTSNTFNGLSGGTYGVFVSDSSGCVYSEELTLITENKFTISTQITGSTCGLNNATVKVLKTTGGTSPFDYILDNTSQIIDTTQSAVTFTNVSQGSHTISVIDADGCTLTEQFFVQYSNPISYSLYSRNCGNGTSGSITAFISSGVPPFTFTWSDNVSGNPQSITATGLTAGTYSVTVVDSTGCSLKRSTTVTCAESFISYQIYSMGDDVFQLKSATKCGLSQMLNEGFLDLTTENTNCILNTATFTAQVSVQPLGSTYSTLFYTSTSLLDAPSDNLWYDTIKTLLLGIDGIQSVVIDPLNNQITIQGAADGPLNNQQIVIDLLIDYDITCSE